MVGTASVFIFLLRVLPPNFLGCSFTLQTLNPISPSLKRGCHKDWMVFRSTFCLFISFFNSSSWDSSCIQSPIQGSLSFSGAPQRSCCSRFCSIVVELWPKDRKLKNHKLPNNYTLVIVFQEEWDPHFGFGPTTGSSI